MKMSSAVCQYIGDSSRTFHQLRSLNEDTKKGVIGLSIKLRYVCKSLRVCGHLKLPEGLGSSLERAEKGSKKEMHDIRVRSKELIGGKRDGRLAPTWRFHHTVPFFARTRLVWPRGGSTLVGLHRSYSYGEDAR